MITHNAKFILAVIALLLSVASFRYGMPTMAAAGILLSVADMI